MDYNWRVVCKDCKSATVSRSSSPQQRPQSSAGGFQTPLLQIQEDSDAVFSIQPQTGTINPGESSDFVVRFAPKKVEEYHACLCCE